jgi:hypothetical protein
LRYVKKKVKVGGAKRDVKLLALGVIAVAIAEPATLTLTCKGVTNSYDKRL